MRRIFSFSRATAGFTLFELLVSISIIGLLIALATVSYSAAQSGARDARRRGDMTSMRNAFEQYYAANNAYPTTCNGTNTAALAATLADYLPGGMPSDPDPNVDTVYTFDCSASTYTGCVALEKEGSGNASDDEGTTDPAGDYFCVKNLQ